MIPASTAFSMMDDGAPHPADEPQGAQPANPAGYPARPGSIHGPRPARPVPPRLTAAGRAPALVAPKEPHHA